MSNTEVLVVPSSMNYAEDKETNGKSFLCSFASKSVFIDLFTVSVSILSWYDTRITSIISFKISGRERKYCPKYREQKATLLALPVWKLFNCVWYRHLNSEKIFLWLLYSQSVLEVFLCSFIFLQIPSSDALRNARKLENKPIISFHFQLTVNQTSHTILPDLPPSPIESLLLVKIYFFHCNIIRTCLIQSLQLVMTTIPVAGHVEAFFQMKIHGAISHLCIRKKLIPK